MSNPNIPWSRLAEVIREGQRFLLTGHARPDCDCLGSELAMAGILESLGKQVRIVNADPMPERLAFIDPQGKVETLDRDNPNDVLEGIDTFMVLDTSAWDQLGAMADLFRRATCKKVVIDHHRSEDDLGAEVFKDAEAEAVGRLVADAVGELGVKMTPEIAMPLFAAIATDTGWFRFSSVTASTYRCIAGLIEAGASPTWIYRELYERQSMSRLLLVGRILAGAQSELDGRLIYLTAASDDFAATGADRSDTEDVINRALEVSGTEVAVLFVATKDGNTKVSLRSRSEVDCSRLAEQLGGGGHRAASGATIDKPLEAARDLVLNVVRDAMK